MLMPIVKQGTNEAIAQDPIMGPQTLLGHFCAFSESENLIVGCYRTRLQKKANAKAPRGAAAGARGAFQPRNGDLQPCDGFLHLQDWSAVLGQWCGGFSSSSEKVGSKRTTHRKNF